MCVFLQWRTCVHVLLIQLHLCALKCCIILYIVKHSIPNLPAVNSHSAVKGLKRLGARMKFSAFEVGEFCRQSTSNKKDSIPGSQPAIIVVTHRNLAPAVADMIASLRLISFGTVRVSQGMFLRIEILDPTDERTVVEEVSRVAAIPGVARISPDYPSKPLNFYAQSNIQSGHRYFI